MEQSKPRKQLLRSPTFVSQSTVEEVTSESIGTNSDYNTSPKPCKRRVKTNMKRLRISSSKDLRKDQSDAERRSMRDLFRARLLNDKGREEVSRLSQRVFERKDWNYRMKHDGVKPFRPPSHLPSEAQTQRILDETIQRDGSNSKLKNKVRFVSAKRLDALTAHPQTTKSQLSTLSPSIDH